eukprot:954972_1
MAVFYKAKETQKIETLSPPLTPPDMAKSNTSFRTVVLSIADHLLYGYTRQYMNYMLPADVMRICWNHFVGDLMPIYEFELFDHQFFKLNPITQKRLVDITLNLLCSPSNHRSASLLFNTIHTLLFRTIPCHIDEYQSQQRGRFCLYFIYIASQICDLFSILTILSSLSVDRTVFVITSFPGNTNDFIDAFKPKYSAYGEIETIRVLRNKWEPKLGFCNDVVSITYTSNDASAKACEECGISINYNRLLIERLCSLSSCSAIKLLCELWTQNESYYKIYRTLHSHGLQFDVFKLANIIQNHKYFERIGILDARIVLAVIILDGSEWIDIKNIHNTRWELFSSWDWNDCYQFPLKFLWIQREIEHLLPHTHANRTCLQKILDDIVHVMIHWDTNTAADTSALRIIYLLVEVYELKLSYNIEFGRCLQGFVNNLLRADEYGIIAWKILDMEIGKLKDVMDKSHCDAFAEYIEQNTELFEMNVTQCLMMLQKENDCDIKNAKKRLEAAIVVCYKIDQLHINHWRRFQLFYKKIEGMRLIKPILQRLEGCDQIVFP